MQTRFLLLALTLVFALSVSANAAIANGYDDVNAGMAAAQRGDFAEAIRLLTLALNSGQLSDKDRGAVLYGRGSARNSEGEYDKAIADFNEALKSGRLPGYDQAYIYFDRAFAWKEKGEYDKAIADYSEAIRLNPKDNRETFDLRGVLRFLQGDFGQAANDFAQAQRLDSTYGYPAIWLYLSRARLGARNARDELAANTNNVDPNIWITPQIDVVALYLGKIGPDAVLSKAAEVGAIPDPKIQKQQECEADFFVGEWYLLQHRKQRARALFRKAQNECPRHLDLDEYKGAVVELKRM
jgi:lipoprotein NlpI